MNTFSLTQFAAILKGKFQFLLFSKYQSIGLLLKYQFWSAFTPSYVKSVFIETTFVIQKRSTILVNMDIYMNMNLRILAEMPGPNKKTEMRVKLKFLTFKRDEKNENKLFPNRFSMYTSRVNRKWLTIWMNTFECKMTKTLKPIGQKLHPVNSTLSHALN